MTGLVFLRFKRSLKLGALLVSVRWGIFVAFSHAPSLSPACYDVKAPRCGLRGVPRVSGEGEHKGKTDQIGRILKCRVRSIKTA